MIYFKLTDEDTWNYGTIPVTGMSSTNQGKSDDNEGPAEGFVKGLARRQSESLSVEIGLLSKLRFGGVVPVP